MKYKQTAERYQQFKKKLVLERFGEKPKTCSKWWKIMRLIFHQSTFTNDGPHSRGGLTHFDNKQRQYAQFFLVRLFWWWKTIRFELMGPQFEPRFRMSLWVFITTCWSRQYGSNLVRHLQLESMLSLWFKPGSPTTNLECYKYFIFFQILLDDPFFILLFMI